MAGGGAARSGLLPSPRGQPPPLLLGAAVVGGLLAHGDDVLIRKEERRAGAKLGAAELRLPHWRRSRAGGGRSSRRPRSGPPWPRHLPGGGLLHGWPGAGWERAASRGDWARAPRRDPGAGEALWQQRARGGGAADLRGPLEAVEHGGSEPPRAR